MLGLELSEIFKIQNGFDRKTGWNTYEKCDTPEEVVAFMEHFTLAVVDELGELSRVRKRFRRDKAPLDVATLTKEMVDIFIFVMQGAMALKINLEDEYLQRMRQNEKRFLDENC